MAHFDDQLPEDLRDIAERLSESRATFTALELDDLHGRVQRRAARSAKGRRFSGLRRGSLAGVLAATLMLTSGAGVVIAATSLGGGSHTFATTSIHSTRDASFCQYHGPVTIIRVIPTFFGIITIVIVEDCGHLTFFHIGFTSFFHGGHSFAENPHETYGNYFGNGFSNGLAWQFGNGPQSSTQSSSVSGSAPADASAITVTSNGASYTVPLNTGS